MLNNKTVLITGGNTGIGLATAKIFAQNKANVLYTYFENPDENDIILNELQKLGAPKTECFFLDLQDDENIKKLAIEIKEKYGNVDYLINNAAVKFGAFLSEQTFAMIDAQINVGLVGTIKLTKEILSLVNFSLINVGSALVLEGAKKNLTIYCAAKYGLRGFTKSLAREYPNLKIYLVNPSLTATRMGHFQGLPKEKTAQIIFNAAIGQYKVKSGNDINVHDYQFNKIIRFFLPFLRFIKKVIKFKI